MTLQWLKSKHSISINTKLNTFAYMSGDKIEKVIICMHGFGDNAENASHLAHAFNLEHVLFLFVEGPSRIPMSFSGFQWFDIFHEPHKKLDASALLILDLFKHLTNDHHIPSHKIFFMGFSQGAALALYTGLLTKQKIGGIVSMSGFLVHTAELLKQQNTFHKDCPILLVHGDEDQTIFPILFFEAQGLLEYMGFKNVLTKLYPMGHTVCNEEIGEIKKFLLNS